MNRLEEVKKYEDRLRKIAEQIVDIADEMGMSVHINSTYFFDGSVSARVNLFDYSDKWCDCKNIATNNKALKCDAIWEMNKRKDKRGEKQ